MSQEDPGSRCSAGAPATGRQTRAPADQPDSGNAVHFCRPWGDIGTAPPAELEQADGRQKEEHGKVGWPRQNDLRRTPLTR